MQNDLDGLDAEALRQRFAELVLLGEETQHIGRKNRISGWQREVSDRLIAIGGDSERELLPLLQYPSIVVRLAAAERVRPFDRGLFVATLGSLAAVGRTAHFRLESFRAEEERAARPPQPEPAPDPARQRILHWQEHNPPPMAMSPDEFQQRATGDFAAERVEQILALARYAIGLWPQARAADDPATSSRHDGAVWAPAGWRWPIWEEEPMFFLGQIRCRDLAGLPGATLLPDDGVLAFFGDHDLITGCKPGGDAERGAVYHWPETGLVPTDPPLPPSIASAESAATPLVFHPFIDLPDRFSAAVEELELSPEELDRYDALRRDSRRHGIPADVANYIDDSKLFGWPDLVQPGDDLPQAGADGFRLLVQLPARLGPGGSLYFFIDEDDLAARRFDRAILEEQST